MNVKDIVRGVAISCEDEDRSDEALVSVGWDLRKGRSPSKPVAVPTRLTVTATEFPGTVRARWRRVPTAKFYEVQNQPLAAARATGPATWEEGVAAQHPCHPRPARLRTRHPRQRPHPRRPFQRPRPLVRCPDRPRLTLLSAAYASPRPAFLYRGGGFLVL